MLRKAEAPTTQGKHNVTTSSKVIPNLLVERANKIWQLLVYCGATMEFLRRKSCVMRASATKLYISQHHVSIVKSIFFGTISILWKAARNVYYCWCCKSHHEALSGHVTPKANKLRGFTFGRLWRNLPKLYTLIPAAKTQHKPLIRGSVGLSFRTLDNSCRTICNPVEMRPATDTSPCLHLRQRRLSSTELRIAAAKDEAQGHARTEGTQGLKAQVGV